MNVTSVKNTEMEDIPKIKGKTTSKDLVSSEDIKHPLENTWSFWMFTNDKKKWELNLVELTSFDTVEDYWCLYHYMKLPSELTLGQDYSVFKKGVRPMWEDAANKKGGRWLFTLEKRRGDTDQMWLDVVLLMIGENFENNNEICGATVNVRAKCKISIWTAHTSNEKAIMEIGKKLKETLHGQNHSKIIYQAHDSNKTLYTV
ncbi:hypothetical protein O0L34_g16183 [Tuta absoluta]|nr:hypothetical protein O0L34_g16183 [Tuta absoluta]